MKTFQIETLQMETFQMETIQYISTNDSSTKIVWKTTIHQTAGQQMTNWKFFIIFINLQISGNPRSSRLSSRGLSLRHEVGLRGLARGRRTNLQVPPIRRSRRWTLLRRFGFRSNRKSDSDVRQTHGLVPAPRVRHSKRWKRKILKKIYIFNFPFYWGKWQFFGTSWHF